MKDLKAMIVAALLVVPAACSHDERDPKTPQQPGSSGTAGAYEVAPAPSTTSKPTKVDSPKLNDTPRQTDPSGIAPVSDSRTDPTPYIVAQPFGGMGGFGGLGGFGTGGSIVTMN